MEAIQWTVQSDYAQPQNSSKESHLKQRTSVGAGETHKAKDGLQVIRRLGFSSALKRMSVVVRASHEDGAPLYILTKGAPETIFGLLANNSVDRASYTSAQKRHTSTGKRVLSLAYRRLDTLGLTEVSQVMKMSRHDLESDLIYAGLLVLDSPLKPQSRPAVHQLMRSSHRVIIITGDNALTACSVSSQLHIMRKPQERQLILKPSTDGHCVSWFPVAPSSGASVSPSSPIPFDQAADAIFNLAQKYDLCVTGSSLSWLARNCDSTDQHSAQNRTFRHLMSLLSLKFLPVLCSLSHAMCWSLHGQRPYKRSVY